MSFDRPEEWLHLFASTIGLIFLGTPFRGRAGMSQSDMVNRAIVNLNRDQVHGKTLDLAVPDNEYLRQTVESFMETRHTSSPILLWCFFETFPSNQAALFGTGTAMVGPLLDTLVLQPVSS
jgi:hypothetical protein